MQIIPPARLSDEMLEQIRTVVREELAAGKSLRESINASIDASSSVPFVSRELTPEMRKQIAEDVKQAIARDFRNAGRIGF